VISAKVRITSVPPMPGLLRVPRTSGPASTPANRIGPVRVQLLEAAAERPPPANRAAAKIPIAAMAFVTRPSSVAHAAGAQSQTRPDPAFMCRRVRAPRVRRPMRPARRQRPPEALRRTPAHPIPKEKRLLCRDHAGRRYKRARSFSPMVEPMTVRSGRLTSALSVPISARISALSLAFSVARSSSS
jgi:hypothetical protein